MAVVSICLGISGFRLLTQRQLCRSSKTKQEIKNENRSRCQSIRILRIRMLSYRSDHLRWTDASTVPSLLRAHYLGIRQTVRRTGKQRYASFFEGGKITSPSRPTNVRRHETHFELDRAGRRFPSCAIGHEYHGRITAMAGVFRRER